MTPYRDAEKSLRERCLALENEIAEIRRRAREVPYLEKKKKNLEDQLMSLTDPDATTTKPSVPRKRVWRFLPSSPLEIALLALVLVGMTLIALRTLGPQVVQAHPSPLDPSDPFYNVPHG